MRKKESNLLRLQELASDNPGYLDLAQEQKILGERFQAVMAQLPKPQRDAVGDYLGLVGEMGRFMLLLACREMKFET